MTRVGRGHALYVAWGFPPAKSGGVFRMMETANVLVEEGWQVTVLACDIDDLRRFAGVDLSTLEGVDDRIRVVRIPMELGPFETDLLRWDELRVDDPARWLAQYRARVDEGFPNGVYGLWEEPLLEAARAVHAENPVDLVVASGGPFVCFSAGLMLRREHGVPFVLDYRDSWSLQQFTGERLHAEGSRVHTVENELLTAAAEVWFVNTPMQHWHEDVYPQIIGKSRVVTNGYDALAVTGLQPPAPREGPVRFGFLGTLTAAVPLTETLAGYRRARALDPVVRESTLDVWGYLGFYPTPNQALREQLQTAAVDDVHWCGPLPKAEVATAYAELDALVLTFGGTRYVTSGKVFEYMATARPIVSIVDPQNAVREVLEGYPLWFQAASLGEEDVAAAFIAAAAAVRSGEASEPGVVATCLAHAERFERRRCLRPAIRDLARTAEWVRGTAAVGSLDSDVVAYVGDRLPPGLREVVVHSGRRLVHVIPDASAVATGVPVAALQHAEPGTLAGRLQRLETLLAGPEPGSRTPDGATTAARAVVERILVTGAGAVLLDADVPVDVMAWLPTVIPGMPVGRLSSHAPSEDLTEADRTTVRGVLSVPPALRLRRTQEPIAPEPV